jgi:hypothetical protein
MDENTKHIVASNLTVAFCSNRQMGPHCSEQVAFESYEKFLLLLDAKFGTTESEATVSQPLSGISTTIAESFEKLTTGKK